MKLKKGDIVIWDDCGIKTFGRVKKVLVNNEYYIENNTWFGLKGEPVFDQCNGTINGKHLTKVNALPQQEYCWNG